MAWAVRKKELTAEERLAAALVTEEEQEHKGDGLLFVPLSSPLGGGL